MCVVLSFICRYKNEKKNLKEKLNLEFEMKDLDLTETTSWNWHMKGSDSWRVTST